MSKSIEDLEKIKMILLDMDGVLTDGGIYLSSDGKQMRRFNAHDGQGIKLAQKAGIIIGIITGSKEDDIVELRASMLGIPQKYVQTDTRDKWPVCEEWMKEAGLTKEQVAYIGDDVPDIEVMSKVGTAACPADSMPEIGKHAHVILNKKGGEGCVREFIDMVLP